MTRMMKKSPSKSSTGRALAARDDLGKSQWKYPFFFAVLLLLIVFAPLFTYLYWPNAIKPFILLRIAFPSIGLGAILSFLKKIPVLSEWEMLGAKGRIAFLTVILALEILALSTCIQITSPVSMELHLQGVKGPFAVRIFQKDHVSRTQALSSEKTNTVSNLLPDSCLVEWDSSPEWYGDTLRFPLILGSTNEQQINVRPKLARLAVVTKPDDARILVDNDSVPLAQGNPRDVGLGKHRIRIARSGYDSLDTALEVHEKGDNFHLLPLKKTSVQISRRYRAFLENNNEVTAFTTLTSCLNVYMGVAGQEMRPSGKDFPLRAVYFPESRPNYGYMADVPRASKGEKIVLREANLCRVQIHFDSRDYALKVFGIKIGNGGDNLNSDAFLFPGPNLLSLHKGDSPKPCKSWIESIPDCMNNASITKINASCNSH
jgi:hypothetical protein